MGLKKGQIVELTITDIAFGGKGFAKVDGFAVFVDQSVPFDKVLARVYKKKKSYAEARLVEILEPSSYRIDSLCDYSGYCGGCKWQFLDYARQLEYKKKHVSDSLTHIGLLKDIPVHSVIPSPEVFQYRNKMEFSCSDRRWLLPDEFENEDTDRGFGIGLHVPGTFSKIIDIRTCHLQPELGNRILGEVRSYIRESGLPVYNLKTHEGYYRFLMLRHSSAKDTWMVNIITSDNRPDVIKPLAECLVTSYPEITSVVNNITSSKAGVAVGEYEEKIFGDAYILDDLGPYTFEISANSFFQTNTKGAERLYEIVKHYAELSGRETVLDLYSGTGTIPIFLSDAAKEIVGMEIVPGAVEDARKNCFRNRIDNCRFIEGDIRDGISRLTVRPDVIIIDPPRTGMHQDVVNQVVRMAAKRIVYVSCNPATLSRDLLHLKNDYRVIEVQPVDMFPHTYHIESVARLEKK
ncbi:MAG: 23S rRNA (uracil(1939)-C(5))-methyltransferase RlmD [Proteobacteria bacterium]|nr:23S rRNA (uracil(1939)-C(5))-methyltransferase RlmD [Pseudomonadota bacterium]